ncbi:MAG TPA: efflux RND transporter periplasmic adaptor subunit, partial [Phycisphaerales bacterium]|nr:efflux RND transporter periplasmic adaptor subunit [Phycisphaerales bacterium]
SGKGTGTEVRLQTVAEASLIQTVKAPGIIEPHTKVDISAEVAARIEDLPFREGDHVRKGDIIVKLDDRDLSAALDAARARAEGEKFRLESERATLVGLNNNLAFQQKELERQQKLLATGDTAARNVEEAQDQVQGLQSNIEASKQSMSVIESSLASAMADIDRAQEALRKTTITSPIDGLVTKLNAEIGEVVLMGTMNNAGTVIMTIADLSRMLLKAEVAESDIELVEKGQKAVVKINAYRDQEFSGTVTKLALQRTIPSALTATASGGTTGYFEVEVELDLQGRQIRSGGQANVDIQVATHTGITVESQAVVDRNLEDLPEDIRRSDPNVDRAKKTVPVVFRMVNNKSVLTPVKVGPSDLTHTLVTAGLTSGDVVVIGPYKVLQELKHDQAIQNMADNTQLAAQTQPSSSNASQEDAKASATQPEDAEARASSDHSTDVAQ